MRAYSPYGETTQSLSDFATPYAFTGELTDASGLVYLRARSYDPATGRFVSRDTWQGEYQNPVSLNKWLYGLGNPVNNTDPTGMFSIASCGPLLIAAIADGILPIGDAAFLACAAIAGISTLALAPMISQVAPEVAEQVGDLYCQLFGKPVVVVPEQNPTPEPELKPMPVPMPVPLGPEVTETPSPKFVLYHYTDAQGFVGILSSQTIYPSMSNDNNAAYGHGQYFTDIAPTEAATGSGYQMSRAIFNNPWLNNYVSYFVGVNMSGLPFIRVHSVFSQTFGNHAIYLIENELPPDTKGRIILAGPVNYAK